MNRKEFISQFGVGAAALLLPACLGGLAACQKPANSPVSAPAKVDFTLDTSTGNLHNIGGYVINNGVIVAKTSGGNYVAVSAACTHQGTNVNFNPGAQVFVCPNHNSIFDSSGVVIQGPATANLTKYSTTLTGTILRVYS